MPKDNFKDGLERDEYDNGHSIPIIALASFDESNIKMVGCLRLILGNKVDILPCEKHLELDCNIDRSITVEISRLIIPTEFRCHYSQDIIRQLTWEVRSYCIKSGIKYALASIEIGTFRLLRNMGYPFQKVGPIGDYMGKVIPVLLPLDDVLIPTIVKKIWKIDI